MSRAAAVLLGAVLAAIALAAVPVAADAKRVRVFAVGPKFSLDWVDTRTHFRDKLFALADADRRRAPAPGVQRAAGDVRSHLLGPADPGRPVATARDLVTLPEDLGLMAAFTGSRGRQARGSADLTGSILNLIGAYSTVAVHYAARFPELAARPFPPTRLLAVSLTDTFVRTGVETFAALADELDAYLVAGVTLAQDWRVVCTSRAAYKAPPGAGPCDVANPALVAQLRDPDEPSRTYAYEATTSKASTMALVFDPDGELVAKTVKAYLTPIELPGQLDLAPGDVSGVEAIPTPVGRLGIVTSKDAWMPDVTAKLDQQRTEILIQPEFFVGDTVRTTGPWAPDNIRGSGPSDVLRHPSIKALVLPQLTGNVFDFSADSQQAIVVRPGTQGRTVVGAMVGQPPAPGYSVVGRWSVPDDTLAGETFAARRNRLGALGEAMLPTSTTACPDALVAGPCRGGQVEDVIFGDVQVGVPAVARRPRLKQAGPRPFTASRPIAATGRPQRNASLASHGSTVVAAYEQEDRVYVARSRDQGANWDRPVPVTSGSVDAAQWWPSASIGPDGQVWVAWQDSYRVLVASAPAGASMRKAVLRFGTPAAAPAGAPAPGGGGVPRQWRPSLASTGPGTAYLAWVDERTRFSGDDLPQAGLYGARVSAGGGVGTALRLDRRDAVASPAGTLDNAWAPSVAARGPRVLLTWVDFRGYDWDVSARESGDGGVSFGTERTVNPTPEEVEALDDTPRAALTPAGRPLVAYTDWFKDARSFAAPSPLYDTRLAGLTDQPVQADDHGGAHVSTFAPALAATAGGDALVAWQDAATGVARVRLARLRARTGARGKVLRVDDGGAAQINRSRPAIALAGSRAVVAWEDERDGPPQLYAGRVTVGRVP